MLDRMSHDVRVGSVLGAISEIAAVGSGNGTSGTRTKSKEIWAARATEQLVF
ncbi:hypothetical protein PM082_017324 [Marasmius tenuissimus]|nr:hypothetical protein PM082_017324 [Marasmius tenuissimus]